MAEDVVGATASNTACAAAAVSDSDSEADDSDEDDQLPAGITTHPTADIANDDDIDENLFDGDDLDIVEQQLDSFEVVD